MKSEKDKEEIQDASTEDIKQFLDEFDVNRIYERNITELETKTSELRKRAYDYSLNKQDLTLLKSQVSYAADWLEFTLKRDLNFGDAELQGKILDKAKEEALSLKALLPVIDNRIEHLNNKIANVVQGLRFNDNTDIAMFFYYSGIYDALKQKSISRGPGTSVAKLIAKIVGSPDQWDNIRTELPVIIKGYDPLIPNSVKRFSSERLGRIINMLEDFELSAEVPRKIKGKVKN
jgi:hypothetical protein